MTIRVPLPMSLGFVAIGVLLGWLTSGLGRTPAARAEGFASPATGADGGRGQVLSGPVVMMMHPKLANSLVAQDAVYFLDYAGGRLLAAVPTGQATANPAAAAGEGRIVSEFAERDLTADFTIPPGVVPQFAMTVARMGSANEGWAPLFVFETTTGQMATYRVKPEMKGRVSVPKIELLDRKSLARTALPSLSR